MIKQIVLFILLINSIHQLAQKIRQETSTLVTESIQRFNDEIGIYIKNLRTGKIVTMNADTTCSIASIVKLPILVGFVDKIQKGELKYDQEFIYEDSLLCEGVDILAFR